MSHKSKPLLIRVISSVIAVTIFIACGYFAGTVGLIAFASLVLLVGMIEFLKIGFIPGQDLPKALQVIYIACNVLLYLALAFASGEKAMSAFALVVIIYFSTLLWLLRDTLPPMIIRSLFFSSLVGFIYTAILPAYAVRTLLLPHGIKWFVLMLTVVFAGDIFAYFSGLKFGNKKLIAEISPKKTIAGSIGGLAGSIVGAGLLGWWFFGPQSLVTLLPSAVLVGFLAQCGDFFESLLKRTCGVKDSGKIMPGHGGVLDRLDGVYFAAPVFYLLAHWTP